MDNCGNFYLGGSAAGCGLAWNASTNCLTVCGCITSYAGTIAGWNINSKCLSKGNLILNSNGAISGCYSGDTTGWCIDAAGNAKFNNATVRGTVCASAGCIGGFCTVSGCFYSEGFVVNKCTYLLPASLCFVDTGTSRTCIYSGGVIFCRTIGSSWSCTSITNDGLVFVDYSSGNYLGMITGTTGFGEGYCQNLIYACNRTMLYSHGTIILIAAAGGDASPKDIILRSNGNICLYENQCLIINPAVCTHFCTPIYSYNNLIVNSYICSTCYIRSSGMVYACGGVCANCLISNSCVRGTFVYSSGRIEASRLGYVGTYNSAETQGIWSMGSSYMPDATTTDFNTLYGMGYSYSTVGGGYFSDHHQVHWVLNGTVNASMSLSGYLWVRNYVISTCVLGSTCVCSPIVCGTTCVNSPIVCGTTCVNSPIVCGTTRVTSPIVCGTTCVYSPIVCSDCFVGPGIGTGNVKAWINFNGTGTISIRGSGGVSSIVDCGTGYYKINFSTAMSSANYAAVGTAGPSPAYLNMPYNTSAYATTYYLVGTGNYSAMADACFVALAFII